MQLLAALLAAGSAGAAELPSREVAFESGGYRLNGTLTLPGRLLGGVLIIPGSGPTDRNGTSRIAPSIPPAYRQWAERLGEGGFGALRFDKRSVTYPDIDFRSFDQEAQIADAVSAVGFLRSVAELASKPIFIVGHSEGGTLAPMVAERSGAVAGVVVVNAVQFPVDELLLAQFEAMNVPPEQRDEVKRLFMQIKDGSFAKGGLLLGVGAAYWRQRIDYSSRSPATLSRLPMPLLLVQSLDDETLPRGTLARNVALLRTVVPNKKSAQLSELPGHDHFGMLRGGREPSTEFMRILLDWLRSEARVTASPARADPSARGTRD